MDQTIRKRRKNLNTLGTNKEGGTQSKVGATKCTKNYTAASRHIKWLAMLLFGLSKQLREQ